jgi:hypothetical protein
MLGATATMLAMWGALRVGAAHQTAGWSSWLRDVASASALGMIGVFALLPRHVRISTDPILAALRALPHDLDGEVRELCTRSVAIWAGASDSELARRMTDLDARIAAASDAEVKAQYQSARAALDDQQRYRDHIAQNRERMIARMHNHVAALEKFQLAAGGLAAARAATAGATAVKQLEELSADVAASGEALAEIELDTTAPAAI